eukprot:905495_1
MAAQKNDAETITSQLVLINQLMDEIQQLQLELEILRRQMEQPQPATGCSIFHLSHCPSTKSKSSASTTTIISLVVAFFFLIPFFSLKSAEALDE